jgi:2-C-methyl-D-erythritol 2,4-cyclodiphosphate synthase
MKIGIGMDIHKLVEKRPLVLGGVNIPFVLGLLGHSDADVVIHSLIDALLGAMGKGDIGELFPSSSAEYGNVRSMLLLHEITNIIEKEEYVIQNIDICIQCESPLLGPYKGRMKINIADVLHIEQKLINIKAGTNEGFDSVGRNEAIQATTIVLLEEKKK